MNKWYRLDNAAKLFPTVTGEKYSSVYRVSAVLEEKVDKELLQRTVDHIFDRFPMLFLRLRKGVFWNYFDTNRDEFFVQEEKDYPCATINPYENNGYLLRILYFENRISVEIFHSLTDGGGALEFLKCLLYYYLRFSGRDVKDEDKILLADDDVAAEETEDSFSRYYEPVQGNTQGTVAAQSFRIKGTPFPVYGNNVITGVVSASELVKAAKSEETTVTAYLATLLAESVYSEQQRHSPDHNPIVISIPVNLRKPFPSRTLRNFFAVSNIEIKMNGETKRSDLVREVTRQLKDKTATPALQSFIAENVGLEKKLYTRFIPLAIKKNMIMIGSDILGESRKTITLSNLGNVSVPSGFSSYVRHLETTLYPTPKSPINCAVCSMGDRLAITFSRTIMEADMIRCFFQRLVEISGIIVDVYSNDWGRELESMR